MSEQVEFLKNLVTSAQAGSDGAVTMLRQICVAAAEAAPVYDLIAIGQCLCHLGVEASRSELGRN
jgi:hypothetical protein